MNALLDYGVSSDDSDTENESIITNTDQSDLKLPKPDFDSSSSSRSVFSNPFTEAEEKERAVLEKHVKMVPTNSQLQTINGKKICWNYRKGRCRFGHNCMFAHDSDLQQTDEQADGAAAKQGQSQSLAIPDAEVESNVADEDNWEGNVTKTKHKRPGLSQTIVPGKKILNAYKKQRLAEMKQ